MTNPAKSAARRAYRQARDSLPGDYRVSASREAVSAFVASDLYRSARLILSFCPTGSEPDIMPVADIACRDGKTCALPRTVNAGGERGLVFHAVTSPVAAKLVRGAYGLSEPDPTCDILTPDPGLWNGAVILTPGLGFDRLGNRIGYGGGYYDRLFCELGRLGVSCITVGVTYDRLLSFTPPVALSDVSEPTDRRVSYILTERGVFAV